jgi:hypothetical protein
MRTAAISLVATCLAVEIITAAPMRLMPIDEAARQPDFFSFRAQLQRTIARRDADGLLAAVSPDIKASFGGDEGIADFRRMWRLGEPDSELWEELGAALSLGGSFQGPDTFVAPYTFSRWPDGVDAFEHVVLIASSVRLRSAPSLSADTLGTDSFAILPLVHDARPAAGEEWHAVRLEDGRTGYVSRRLARSPIDYRAIFSRSPAGWRLVTFVAGD